MQETVVYIVSVMASGLWVVKITWENIVEDGNFIFCQLYSIVR